MDNIDFNYIEGFFGDTSVAIPSSTIDLNLDMLNQFEGEITFEDPSIAIGVTNSVGLPIALDLDFTSYRDGTGYDLNASPQMFPYPTTIGDSASGTITYDNTNSSISSVFTFPSDSLSYGGSVSINPDTLTYGKYNFITSDSKISGDLLLELPFEFTTSGLTLGLGLDSNLNLASSLQQEEFEMEFAKLKVYTESTLPLDAYVDLKFYDANGNLLLLKPLPLLDSGIPNSDGIVMSPKITMTELELTKTDFEAIMDAKLLYAEATMSTYNQGAVPVKLRTDAYITIDLSMEAQISYELL